jgi:hypothetical protein
MTLNWIPIEEKLPEADYYILLSFSNWGIPGVGRFEDGNFYGGDDDKPLDKIGIFVNAWMPLPKCYRREDDQ